MLFFVFTRAAIVEFNPEVPCLYPYFFFNLDNIGVVGVAKGGAILFAGFISLGVHILRNRQAYKIQRIKRSENDENKEICHFSSFTCGIAYRICGFFGDFLLQYQTCGK